MKQWKYLISRFQTEGITSLEKYDAAISEWINRVGRQGWELVAVPNEIWSGESVQAVAYFKKED